MGRPVAKELRRLVARMGGAPRTHAVEAPPAAVHAASLCEARTGAIAVGIPVEVLRPVRPGAGALAVRPPPPAAALGGAEVHLMPPAVRTGSLATVLRVHDAGIPDLLARARPVAVCRAVERGAPRTIGRAVAARAESPLPPITALGGRPRPDSPLFVSRRRRVDWAMLDRARLARGWTRVLREHGLPADDLRLVGVFGPLPLAAVAAATLEADGRLAVRLARPPVPGPAGDVVLARHEPTGALLRSDLT